MNTSGSPSDRSATVEMLSLPSQTLDQISQPAVRDVISYYEPDVIAIPGQRSPKAHAAARAATVDCPIAHPQLAEGGTRIQHYCYHSHGKLSEPTDNPAADTIDIVAVQSHEVLEQLQQEFRTNSRPTGSDCATFVIVPQLTVSRDPTALSATLPEAQTLAKLGAAVSEPVTVLAGGQPADYFHEWNIKLETRATTVPVAGLGDTEHERLRIGLLTCTPDGHVATVPIDADGFGLQALDGVGKQTADQLRRSGCRTITDVQNMAISHLTGVSGIGQATAKRMHAHADVLASGKPVVMSNKSPVKTRGDRPPLCIDIETDGLSPTIIWQIGVYDPENDTHQAFIERDDPTDPVSVLEAFITWLLANHDDRTLLTWNGYDFDYRHIRTFLDRYLPAYVEAWEDCWKYDLYQWAVRDGNALLPGRTNKLDHVARALGYESVNTGLTGAQTATAYQQYMRDPTAELDWERHRRYCEDDCRALWYVYQAIVEAPRRDMTDSGTGGQTGQQAGLTDF